MNRIRLIRLAAWIHVRFGQYKAARTLRDTLLGECSKNDAYLFWYFVDPRFVWLDCKGE